MITPGFFGFFNAQRALITAQNALSTINHNIANVNTPGYSRQRVEISAFDAYQAPGWQAAIGGQIGQGSMVDQVIRIRDAFLDAQYIQENSTLGFNSVKQTLLGQMEAILNEPSDSGINSALARFFDAAQELSIHPDSIPVRQDFIQAAADFTTVVNQIGTQLYDVRTNLVGDHTLPQTIGLSQAALVVNQINEKLASIAGLNKQIVTVFASGAQPNDLLDQRDKLLDELSELVDIEVTHRERGLVDVAIGTNPAGGGAITVVRGAELLDTLSYTLNNTGAPNTLNSNFNRPGFVRLTNNPAVLFNDVFAGEKLQSGKLTAILQMGYGDYPPTIPAANQLPYDNVRTLMQDLTIFMANFADSVNDIQRQGLDINGNSANLTSIFLPATPIAGPVPLPTDPVNPVNGLLSYRVNPVLFGPGGPDLIAAAINDPAAPGPPVGFAGVGDGRNALAIAQLRDQNIGGLSGLSFGEYLNGRISQVGIQSRTFQDRTTSQQNVVNALEQRRQATSGVSLDEETIDMVRFQRAFEASSRVIRSLDEIIETIINMT